MSISLKDTFKRLLNFDTTCMCAISSIYLIFFFIKFNFDDQGLEHALEKLELILFNR